MSSSRKKNSGIWRIISHPGSSRKQICKKLHHDQTQNQPLQIKSFDNQLVGARVSIQNESAFGYLKVIYRAMWPKICARKKMCFAICIDCSAYATVNEPEKVNRENFWWVPLGINRVLLGTLEVPLGAKGGHEEAPRNEGLGPKGAQKRGRRGRDALKAVRSSSENPSKMVLFLWKKVPY